MILLQYRLMEFEYDPKKSAANKAKHGLDFEEARHLWSDPFLIEAPALTEDEPRFLAVGRIGEKHWTAVFTRAGSGCGSSRRSEEHTSELQSLMRISYAVFCLKKKKK